MRAYVRGLLVALSAILVPASAAHAAGWEKMPNGEWQFVDWVTTTGFFTCGSPTQYRNANACSANGNTLVLRSGSSELTVSFSGLAQSIASSNIRSAPIAMGTLSTVITGGPFTMPPVFSDQSLLFTFTLLLTGDLSGGNRITSGYTASNKTSLPYNCCEGFATYTTLGVPGQPAFLRYTGSVYDGFVGRDIAFDGSSSLVTSRVGLIPEPSTYVLVGSGLLALAALGRKRGARRR
jgi:hypothetical protein